ncbi:hypothetical protein GCK32_000493 [Trichostrongylus colubriformis]|uniref:Lipocalin n=1 Tax=Trichostrongylus colubriformis TaxID=6319 RepID=A0AAN8IW11_TRICO
MLVGFISIIAMLLACLIVFIAALHNRVCRAQQTVWDHTTPFSVGLNEITFSKYSIENYYTDKHCLSFLTLRGTESTCTKYFLLVDDWYSFERRTWDKGYDAGDCKKVEFYNSVLVLIKYDVMKDTSPKLVGTYSKTRDRLYYIDHENKRMMVTNFKRRISLGLMAASRYEVMCAVARKY